MNQLESSETVIVDWHDVEAAFDVNDKVTGTVISVVKGGYRVALSTFEAFVPATQIALHPPREPDAGYIGKPLEFHILKLDARRKSIVLSRIALLRAAQAQRLAGLKLGDVLEGTVSKIVADSAFVELGGVEGRIRFEYLPVSEKLTWALRFELGQKVQVRISRINLEKARISLALMVIPALPATQG